MVPESIRVELGERSYDILIGNGLLASSASYICPMLPRPRLAIIADPEVSSVYLSPLSESLESAGIKLEVYETIQGEAAKTWSELERIVEWLLSIETERGDFVAALGGGVVGDLAGFAAAVLRRGVRFIQLPTTLLAQVDSSVGGKTGINSVAGKNLIGAFHQPSLVLADISTLSTLDERNFLAGYAEVAKYGLLGDRNFFGWLERRVDSLKSGMPADLATAIRRCCELKAAIVAEDETERGKRMLLNLGHTFAHALEAATGYSDRLLHGEAVSIGCVLAAEFSCQLGYCGPDVPSRVRRHFRDAGAMNSLAEISGQLPPAEKFLDFMRQDKKSCAGRLRFVLFRGVGDAFVAHDVSSNATLNFLKGKLGER
ncbi:MAG: 3-dehydroquinate synthase [Albidovulum sp.]|nr:3-dehydroquinate synthase [Albidovulum sp.]